MTPPRSSRLMHTVATVSELLGVSEMTVRRMIEDGELRGYRIGRRNVRVDARDLQAYMRGAATIPWEES